MDYADSQHQKRNSSNLSESGSDSDVDSFTEDLDQIGRFNIPSLSAYISRDSLPSLSSFPSLGNLPNLPNLANLPALPNLPNLPQFANFSGLSSSASFPNFDLAEVSRYISQYVNNATSGLDPNGPFSVYQSRADFVNSVKTAVAMRLQMTTFLSDLKGGQSFQAAIARLQPITQLIHEAITLPADDETDDEVEKPEKTEPEGVDSIVNRDQPFLNGPVVPEAETIPGYLFPTATRRQKRKSHFEKRSARILSDEYGSNTDLDVVEELTREEADVLTHLDSLGDFLKENMLRQKIQRINAYGTLSQRSKNKLVTKLMMGNYYKYKNAEIKGQEASGSGEREDVASNPDMEVEPNAGPNAEDISDSDNDEVALTAADILPSFHNETLNILGCSHYQRNCKLECPTCLKWYVCRFCHDSEIAEHKLSRNDVKHILCMKCNTPQVPDTDTCVNCEEELANYFCLKCVLYDNDPTKDIYHCDKCGICRLGLGLSKDYFHCDTCNICLSIDLKQHHKCVSNTTHCNCPICSEYLFTSVHKVVFMKCGHSIHEHCYDEMIKHSYKCPICKKTVVNTETQFRVLDQEIRQSPLPAPYDKWRCIISCNDCKGKSSCSYHVMGLKCRYCASYNTNQLKLIKPEEGVESEGENSDENEAKITSMRLMKTTLGSNFLIDERGNDKENDKKENGKFFDRDGDSAYEGDANSEASDVEDDDMAAMVNMKRIKRAVLGERKLDRTSISVMFQNFINATIMDDEDGGGDKKEGGSESAR